MGFLLWPQVYYCSRRGLNPTLLSPPGQSADRHAKIRLALDELFPVAMHALPLVLGKRFVHGPDERRTFSGLLLPHGLRR